MVKWVYGEWFAYMNRYLIFATLECSIILNETMTNLFIISVFDSLCAVCVMVCCYNQLCSGKMIWFVCPWGPRPWRFLSCDESQRKSIGSAGHSLQFLNAKHFFLWLEHAFEWSSGYFIHYFGICCVPWLWVRFRCQTFILTFKEEVKCDIDEGVRVSSLMVSVGIIS